ncbi:3-phosphoshikimate 1-carboxyvinyltransferase [Streptomyces olivaceoviridis]|uniref:3-phosphoshikimate 1-carboxyvinyltransferase n=1 Tax=Streptomyces olivaceoviridis TaxID=1921 RepID=UPI0036FB20F7
MRLIVERTSGTLKGDLTVPGSKYHSHRALILASLAPGTSRITNLSDSRQIDYTVNLLRGLGTDIRIEGSTAVVTGGPYRPVRDKVTAGACGTTLYLALGLTALSDAPVTVVGQKYFQRRPIAPMLRSLRDLGLTLEATADRPPIRVTPGRPRGGRTRIDGTLSQWISGLLLTAPFAEVPTVIEIDGRLNERSYIELTVSMMRDYGLRIAVSEDWRTFEIPPGQQARPFDYTVPPDLGSAAFGLAATAIHPSDVLFRGLPSATADRLDHPEAHILDILHSMGLPMEPEPGGVRVRHDGLRLDPVSINCREVPDMLPVLAGLAGYAHGATVFNDVEHVRLKECDRVTAMCQLEKMGGRVEMTDGRLVVHGGRPLTGADLSSYNDHRVLMALAVAASRAEGGTTLTYPSAYRTSYPGFLEDMVCIGIPMEVGARPVPRRRPAEAAPMIPAPRAGSASTLEDRRGAMAVQAARDAERPITDWVLQWAERYPDQPAVIDVREHQRFELTWRELWDQADRLATFLAGRGVRRGSTVACQLPNWLEFVTLSLATLRLGAVCCPLMPIFREREMAQTLGRSGASILVVPAEFRGRDYPREIAALLAGPARPSALTDVVVVPSASGAELPHSTEVRWHNYAELIERTAPDPDLLARGAPDADSFAQLLFTSGTTGEPKGVLHRHRSLTLAAGLQRRHLGLTEKDRLYVPSPLAHQTGFLYGMWLSFLLGVPQVLQDVWDPRRGLSAMRDAGATFVQAATPFLDDLLREVEGGERVPERLRIFVVTGAAVPRDLARRATDTLGVMVSGAWGTTETCLGALATPDDTQEEMWGTDGVALPGIQLRVTRDSTVLPPGEEGELEVLSPTFFAEYRERPELTAAAFTADGWYRTGDLATVSAAGRLRIAGRLTDVINRGGEKVPVAEVEQLLHEHPAVRTATVVAMPDQRLGERACAFVVVRDGQRFDLALMRAHLAGRGMARPYWPERVEIVDALPTTITGKIRKTELRARAAELVREHAGQEVPQ